MSVNLTMWLSGIAPGRYPTGDTPPVRPLIHGDSLGDHYRTRLPIARPPVTMETPPRMEVFEWEKDLSIGYFWGNG